MTDPLRLAIEAALEMAESLIAAAHSPTVHPMPKPLRDQIWADLDAELEHSGMHPDVAFRLYAEEAHFPQRRRING